MRIAHQFEEIDKLVGVLSTGQVQEVPWDSIGQTWTRLDGHFAGGVTESRAVLLTHVGWFTPQQLRGFLPASLYLCASSNKLCFVW